MSRLRITTARAWHSGAVARILSASLREQTWLTSRLTRGDCRVAARRMIALGGVRIAWHGRRIVGFMAVREGEVEALYVAPRERGQGIGAALIATAKGVAMPLTLRAHAANHLARRFYMAQGFRPIGFSDDNDDRLTDIRYLWEPAT